jgi:chemotaxis protein CheZ
MEYEVESEDPRLDLARQLVKQLKVSDEEKVNYILSELTQIRHDNLFCEVAKLTRELHEMLNNFSRDSRISFLAEHDIPDAKKRLSDVINMTEESALRTLQAVEHSVTLSQTVRKRIAHFKKSWQSFRRHEITPNQFRRLNQDMDVFLEKTDDEVSQIHGHLSEILLAQETQDLSGQIICKVIKLVQNVENSLVDLIRMSGRVDMSTVKKGADMHNSTGSSSVADEVNTEDTVQSQDEVDELLLSLGF